MKIVLLGYMASGKSLIGRELAKVLKMDYLDLDDFIEKNEGKSIEKIFLEKGEIF
ncbi:MAG TPA: shikimate kinase, partial [Xanthomarina gelatinilytica]|nr:shikimate kinase [Xanthomarina gelatinilytica]